MGVGKTGEQGGEAFTCVKCLLLSALKSCGLVGTSDTHKRHLPAASSNSTGRIHMSMCEYVITAAQATHLHGPGADAAVLHNAQGCFSVHLLKLLLQIAYTSLPVLCACMCVSLCGCMCVSLSVSLCLCVCVCMCVSFCVYKCISVRTCVCLYASLRMSLCKRLCMSVGTPT
jgi:hypothetical protein